jgi:putative ABC transport system substrate-binding protein
MAIFNPANSGAALFVGSAEKAGHKVSVLLLVCRVQGAADIETAISDLGKQSGGGLIVPPDTFTTVHHKPAARYRIPAVYARRFFVDEGGLLSYGLDVLHQYRQAAD